MPAREVDNATVAHERQMLKRAVSPRLEALNKACQQVAKLAVYNPSAVQCAFIMQQVHRMVAEVERQLGAIEATQIALAFAFSQEESIHEKKA